MILSRRRVASRPSGPRVVAGCQQLVRKDLSPGPRTIEIQLCSIYILEIRMDRVPISIPLVYTSYRTLPRVERQPIQEHLQQHNSKNQFCKKKLIIIGKGKTTSSPIVSNNILLKNKKKQTHLKISFRHSYNIEANTIADASRPTGSHPQHLTHTQNLQNRIFIARSTSLCSHICSWRSNFSEPLKRRQRSTPHPQLASHIGNLTSYQSEPTKQLA